MNAVRSNSVKINRYGKYFRKILSRLSVDQCRYRCKRWETCKKNTLQVDRIVGARKLEASNKDYFCWICEITMLEERRMEKYLNRIKRNPNGVDIKYASMDF